MNNPFKLGESKSLLVGFTVLLFTFVNIGITPSQAQNKVPDLDIHEAISFVENNPVQVEPVPAVVYLPIVHRILPPEITKDYPIWAHDTEPLKHEVVLFRRVLNLDEILEKVELHIFADTRYEIG